MSNNSKDIKGMLKDAVILFIITLIAGAVLGTVYQVTKEPIALQKAKAKQEACQEVFREAKSFEAVEAQPVDAAVDTDWAEQGFEAIKIDEVMKALDGQGKELGYVLTVTTAEGYAGDIQFTMGIASDGTLNGISILSIKETAGLGMKAEDVLQPQFAGKKTESFEYTKTGAVSESQIDAISGATITTKAFTNGVNAGLYYTRTRLMTGGQ